MPGAQACADTGSKSRTPVTSTARSPIHAQLLDVIVFRGCRSPSNAIIPVEDCKAGRIGHGRMTGTIVIQERHHPNSFDAVFCKGYPVATALGLKGVDRVNNELMPGHAREFVELQSDKARVLGPPFHTAGGPVLTAGASTLVIANQWNKLQEVSRSWRKHQGRNLHSCYYQRHQSSWSPSLDMISAKAHVQVKDFFTQVKTGSLASV